MAKSNILTRSKKQRAFELLHTGQFALAKDLLEELCRLDHRDPETWYMLGHACDRLGLPTPAESHYRQVLALQPRHPDAHYRLGNALLVLGRHEDAETHLRTAVDINPRHVEAHSNLGVLLERKGDFPGAARCHQDAIALDSRRAQLHYNLANVQVRLAEFPQAEESYRRALELAPTMQPALYNLATLLAERGRFSEAIATYQVLLKVNPAHMEADENLQTVFVDQGRYAEAIDGFRRLVATRGCHGIAYQSLLASLNFDPALTQHEILAAHRQWAEACAPAEHHDRSDEIAAIPERRLRIGYVSPDFRAHSVASFLEPVLTHHDTDGFDVVCYAEVARPDRTTERLRQLVGNWRSTCGQSDEQVATMIRQDGIDILVDLAGHTRNNRLTVFTRRPAPIQVTYLGYPNTTGLTQIDYRLTDAVADPPQADALHTERLVRLPQGFLCYSAPPGAPSVATVPAIAHGHVTFGSLNNLAKVNERVVELWAQVLHAVSGSRLALKGKALGDQLTAERFVEMFARHDIQRDRLVLAGWAATRAQHLETYARIDIALDPFPYNGTTTTCEALWMGVPVVVLEGDRHAARVGVSILTCVGLEKLVAATPADYVRIAADLAADRGRLTTLRTGLRQRLANSPLCDATAFARDLEAAYRTMWRKYCGAALRPA
jgi:predicted O-linked N-acetylglucosamine transferase (SPINDLY family)